MTTVNEAWEVFKNGLSCALRQWTALTLAVDNNWGGGDSRRKADLLREQLIDVFKTSKTVHRDDIDDFLQDYLEEQFSTVTEDGSTSEVAALLLEMFSQCGRRDLALANMVIARDGQAGGAATSVRASGGSGGGDGDDDSSSSEDEMEDAVTAGAGGASSSAAAMGAAEGYAAHGDGEMEDNTDAAVDGGAAAEDRTDAVPTAAAAAAAAATPDPDGWETVKTRKGSGHQRR